MDTIDTPSNTSVQKRKTKPSYMIMIAKALVALNESEKKLYHSRYKITKFITATYPVPDSFKRYLRLNLKEGVTKSYFLQRRDSFRLGRLGKMALIRPVKPKKKRALPRPITSSKGTSTRPATSEAEARRLARRARRQHGTSSSASSIIPSSASGKYKWQYQENSSTFGDYGPKASALVEQAYCEYMSAPSNWDVRSVRSGEWCYQVDFPNMIQTNIQHENHKVRRIRRVSC